MIRRSLLLSAATLSAALVCAPKAMAQDTLDVPFEGEVFAVCALELVSGGQLVGNNARRGGTAYALYSEVPAEITANCNSEASMYVDRIVQTGGPNLFGRPEAYLFSEFDDGYSISLNRGQSDIEVVMDVDNGDETPIPTGNYSFEVTVTVIGEDFDRGEEEAMRLMELN